MATATPIPIPVDPRGVPHERRRSPGGASAPEVAPGVATRTRPGADG